METRAYGLLATLLLLAGAASAVLVVENQAASYAQQAEPFQRLVGGLGFGPDLDLSACPFSFDPRLDGRCVQDCGPVPGGACFCPRHAGSIFFVGPLQQGVPLTWDEEGHAPPS